MAGTNVTAQLFAQDKDSSLRAPVQVAEAIRSASASTQVGFKYLLASAAQESGFRADADPLRDPTAVVSGAYILDPWYPTISSIWGASDPPGFFHDTANLTRNFLAWKRPEGTYPDRDGRFIVVIPTIPRDSGG